MEASRPIKKPVKDLTRAERLHNLAIARRVLAQRRLDGTVGRKSQFICKHCQKRFPRKAITKEKPKKRKRIEFGLVKKPVIRKKAKKRNPDLWDYWQQ
jgi:transposase-like protein